MTRPAIGKLEFPLRQRPQSPAARGSSLSNYVDLSAGAGITTFDCSGRSYDGHTGIDYSLGVFGWRDMDALNVEIVSAATGVIVDKHDGEPDRNCTAPNVAANYVVVRHPDGIYAYYYHMKLGTLTTKLVGASVARGEFLGLVGSSGRSTGPHLHFELRDGAGGVVVDPYAGACGATPTVWKHQHEAVDTEIMRVATHASAPPGISGSCDNPDPGYTDSFAAGATVFVAAYLKDQTSTAAATIEVLRPDGTVFFSGLSGAPPPGTTYIAAYWTFGIGLPASPTGLWTARATLDGRRHEHSFRVGAAAASASVTGLVDPQARSMVDGTGRSVVVTASNAAAVAAEGCFVAPDVPLDATVSFHLLSGAGVPVGLADRNFAVPARGSQKVRLTITGKPGAVADNIEVPVRIRCLNAMSSVRTTSGFNTMWLSFSPAAKPDVIPVATTPANLGIVHIPGNTGTVVLRVASTNAGAAGTLIVRARPSRTGLPLTLKICRLRANNTCIATPAASVSRGFVAGGTDKWNVYVHGTAGVPFNAVTNRVIVEFVDALGKVRGQTTVAVRTN